MRKTFINQNPFFIFQKPIYAILSGESCIKHFGEKKLNYYFLRDLKHSCTQGKKGLDLYIRTFNRNVFVFSKGEDGVVRSSQLCHLILGC